MVTKQPSTTLRPQPGPLRGPLFASGAAPGYHVRSGPDNALPGVLLLPAELFFWVFLVEAFMFLGQIIIVYAWYNVLDKLAYRRRAT
jgi:cytochrome d ubiquinol oxidase subunit I